MPLRPTNSFLLALSLTFLFNFAHSDPSWKTISIPPGIIGRNEGAFARCSPTKLCLLGGRGTPGVSILDTEALSYSDGAPPPIELHHFQAFLGPDSCAWVVGAWTGPFPDEASVPEIWIYCADTDQWSTGPDISRPRGAGAAFLWNDAIYLLGGNVGGHNIGATLVPWFDRYDIATRTWSELPDLPNPRDHFHAVVLRGKVYVAGGRDSTENFPAFFNDVESAVDVFDLATNTWSSLPDFPRPRGGTFSAVHDGQVFVMGGEGFDRAWSEVDILEGDTFRPGPDMPSRRHGAGAVSCNGVLWVAGGVPVQAGGAPNTATEAFFDGDDPNPCTPPRTDPPTVTSTTVVEEPPTTTTTTAPTTTLATATTGTTPTTTTTGDTTTTATTGDTTTTTTTGDTTTATTGDTTTTATTTDGMETDGTSAPSTNATTTAPSITANTEIESPAVNSPEANNPENNSDDTAEISAEATSEVDNSAGNPAASAFATPAPAEARPTITPTPMVASSASVEPRPSESPKPSSSNIVSDNVSDLNENAGDPEPTSDTSSNAVGEDEEGEESPGGSPENGASDPVCFSSDNVVHLRDGTKKFMHELRIGDFVKVAHPDKFSPVYFFSHHHRDVTSNAIRIRTGNESISIEVSPSHLLYVNGVLAPASTVRVGDKLEVSSENHRNSAVTTIDSVRATGLHNPHTVQGDIVVGGVVASTFTTTVHPMTARVLLVPLKAAFHVTGPNPFLGTINHAILRTLDRFYWKHTGHRYAAFYM